MTPTRASPADAALAALSEQTGRALLSAHWRLVTAESCTGGWIAKCLTDHAGSSQWFERGYVTYSNSAKEQALAVPSEVLERYGAVSARTAEQMAAGALGVSGADVAVAVTGVAGPDGGTTQKPLGLVWLALARRDAPTVAQERHFQGDREAIRRGAVAAALQLVLSAAQGAAGRAPALGTRARS